MDSSETQIIITLITVAGSISVAYVTYVLAKRRRERRPRDRMETIFDGYEKLIAQQQKEIDRKGGVITSLESIVSRLEEELKKTRVVLADAKADLKKAREENADLKTQLAEMKRDYHSVTPTV